MTASWIQATARWRALCAEHGEPVRIDAFSAEGFAVLVSRDGYGGGYVSLRPAHVDDFDNDWIVALYRFPDGYRLTGADLEILAQNAWENVSDLWRDLSATPPPR